MSCDVIVISDIRKILGNVALWRVRRDKHINDYGDKWLSVLTVKYILEGYIRQNGQRRWSLTHNHFITQTIQIPTVLNGTETRKAMKYISSRKLAPLPHCIVSPCSSQTSVSPYLHVTDEVLFFHVTKPTVCHAGTTTYLGPNHSFVF